jgi:hypothetical protein
MPKDDLGEISRTQQVSAQRSAENTLVLRVRHTASGMRCPIPPTRAIGGKNKTLGTRALLAFRKVVLVARNYFDAELMKPSIETG